MPANSERPTNQPRELIRDERPARFSPEQRKIIEERGLIIHELRGKSIADLRKAGNRFHSNWHRGFDSFESIASHNSEVAILSKLFLPGSSEKSFAEQQEMVAKFGQELGIEGVEAKIGEVADYAELAFTHLAETEEYLFGQDFGFEYTRTKTPTYRGRVALVGSFSARSGLFIKDWSQTDQRPRVHVVPLIVPVAA